MTLELKAVSRRVGGKTHIYPTSLTLQNGTMNVLLGPTLSGKTSLMRLMAGLDQPSSGRVFWNGEDVTGRRVQDRGVAMVYQQFINYPGLTVYENIASPLRILGRAKDEIDNKVRETAEMLHLTPMLARKPLELSGGQQQRCALARALVKGAGLVLLDEPLANLDYKLREELRVEIPRIFEASGAIFVYATTEPEEALLLGGNTATMWEGRVTQFGPTPRVYREPVDAITARVFSDPPMNFTPVRKGSARLSFGEGVPAPAEGAFAVADGDYLAGFRANHLSMDRHVPDALEFRCKVLVTEITGAQSFIHVAHGEESWIALVEGVHDMARGQEISLWLDPRHVYLFDGDGRLAARAAYANAA
ncbi:ABC transporter ATP-binding protein [Paracoccus sp. MBLB3053]|uniref:ABC transporter ATP-binding protein n=1 Tax=Paracoccus aurantius TaxID=3073814 RepID=A0ABU2HNQ0_9RHOB|nr:ABC transporter ATP-binding protein [Paracoccus sp. MBLB3053]MDS9466661.1 ABC transporter ATP-binding protein [Paracoccus sp. MBLB3053]